MHNGASRCRLREESAPRRGAAGARRSSWRKVLTGTEREQAAEPSRRAWPGWLRRWAVARLDLDKLGIDFVLPGGTRLASANGRPLATVRVLHAVDLFRMLWDPEDTFAEGYTTGRVEVEGDLEGLLERIYTVSRNRRSPEWYTAQGLLEGTRNRARASVRRHYDLGNDFYALWLDRDMVYTCAYFPRAGCHARGSAGRQARSRLPETASRAGRDRVRSGMRMGRAGAAHGAQLRRHGPRVQHLSRADRLCAGARCARGHLQPSSSSKTTTVPSRGTATRSCRWGCSNTSACATTSRSAR